MAGEEVTVEIGVEKRSEARAVDAVLNDLGAGKVRTRNTEGGRGLAEVPSLIVAGIVAVTALPDLYERCRRNHMCQEIILVGRDGDLAIKRNCSVRDGRIILIWPASSERVEIHDVPPGIDITKIAEAVVRSGADAAKAAAESLGAKADGPYRRGDRRADRA